MTSALHEPHLPALQFQRTARSLAWSPLDAVNDVEDDQALLERHACTLELPALASPRKTCIVISRVGAAAGPAGRHFFSSNGVCSSGGIAGKASWVTISCPSRIRTTTLTLPIVGVRPAG